MECNSVNIYDIDLNRIGALYTWISMVWTEGYNTDGMFQIELQQNDRNFELMQENRYCGIEASDTLMWIESIQIGSNRIIANGFPVTKVLDHRVSTEEISNKVAETAMRGLVSDMEPWPLLELGESAGISARFTPQTSDKSILEYCKTIGQECDVGFKITHDKKAKKLLFTCYMPEENENHKYSTLYNNAGDITYLFSDSEYKNVAVVAGSGEGDERITVIAGNTSATGADRREMYVDARNVQPEDGESESAYKQRLVEYGEGKLVEAAEVENIAFTVKDEVALGDIVFVNMPELGLKVKARVVEVTITSQNNGTTREITVGTPYFISRS